MQQALRSIKPVQRRVDAAIAVPGSKSITNRAFLIAALAEGESVLSGVLSSDDTVVFIDALKSLGFAVDYNEAEAVCRLVGNGGRIPKSHADVWCGSAGTASRFLLAAVAAGQGTFTFDATAQMRSRPIGPLVEALRQQGAVIDLSPAGSFPLTVEAHGLRGGRIALSRGDESSQYLSAVLMASPLARAPVDVETAVTVSRPFVDMTVRMMEDFGVHVERTGYERFHVDAPAPYRGRAYTIEPDASTASYFFAAAAVTGGRVRVPKLPLKASFQGDVRFVEVLQAMGCTVRDTPDGVVVEGPARLKAVTVDMGDISDTVMTLAAIAPFADGPTTIANIGHIRLQESDRIAAMASNLERVGIRAEAGRDFLRVHPGKPHGAVIDPHGDHRIAMSFSVMGLVTDGIGISDPECVAKTCPQFYSLLDGLY